MNINTNQEVVAAFLPAAVDACCLYRMYQPHLNIKNSKFFFRLGALDVRELAGVQVVVVQRQFSDDNLKCMKRLKAEGFKVVYDLDDNIWALTASNPHQKHFDALSDNFYKCAREASALTVSTQGLKSATKQGFNLPLDIYVVPNSIDLDMFHPQDVVENNDLTIIGWGGSNTHGNDVKEAFSIIPELLDEYPNLRMEIMGAPAQDKVKERINDVKGRVIIRETMKSSQIAQHKQTGFRPWVPVPEYANRLSSLNWDIFLAPLEETRFNKSKSAIKMLEAAALKKPCLASDVQPYNEFASLGGDDLKWLLCNSPSDWKDKLRVLINEPERRKELGEQMYAVTKQFFNAAIVAENWKYVFRKVCGLA